MSRYLTPSFLEVVRQNINQTLIETFETMFHLEASLFPKSPPIDGDEMLCAYMRLAFDNHDNYLIISISRNVLNALSEQINPGGGDYNRAVEQDIVCEINNIVGNRLTALIRDNLNIVVTMDLPRAGLPLPKERDECLVKANFRLRDDEWVSLAFACKKRSAGVSNKAAH